jgi:rhodanese-related sulfurtransferase
MSKDKRKSKKKASRSTKTNFNWTWIVAGIAVISLIIVGAVALIPGNNQNATRASAPNEITVAQAYQKYQDGVYLLDVRTTEEWVEYHAPDTTLIPLDELEARVNEVPKDQEIIVVCRSGNRSQVGRDILREAGYTNVTSMAGGLNAWRSAGYPTTSGQ